jgi:ATP-dependent DNA helicase RecG
MHDTMQDTTQDTMQDKIEKILLFCRVSRTRLEIQRHVKVKNREYFRRNILNPLISCGKLELSIPDKPRSKNQRYFVKNRSNK